MTASLIEFSVDVSVFELIVVVKIVVKAVVVVSEVDVVDVFE